MLQWCGSTTDTPSRSATSSCGWPSGGSVSRTKRSAPVASGSGPGTPAGCRGNAPTSRQVTSRRGVLEDQWRAKACVAGIGPGRKRHRHLIQSKRDGRAASRFFRILLKHQCHPPRVLITDRLGSYRVADRRRWRKLSAAEQVFEQQVRRIPITTAARTDNERVPHRSARPSGFCPQSVGSPHFHPPRRRMTATDYPGRTGHPIRGVGSAHRADPRRLTDHYM